MGRGPEGLGQVRQLNNERARNTSCSCSWLCPDSWQKDKVAGLQNSNSARSLYEQSGRPFTGPSGQWPPETARRNRAASGKVVELSRFGSNVASGQGPAEPHLIQRDEWGKHGLHDRSQHAKAEINLSEIIADHSKSAAKSDKPKPKNRLLSKYFDGDPNIQTCESSMKSC